MKVTIKYEFLPEYNHAYFAKATVNGIYFSECSSQSYEEAKQKLIKELIRFSTTVTTTPPPSEEVEIEGVEIHANQG